MIFMDIIIIEGLHFDKRPKYQFHEGVMFDLETKR